ncbi:molybdopterin molybdotransferase MoeA [Paractinoplanes rishiriensis]|uniref:Molybdopterin molybdenumtransferase n=1 Tax=Paractinoplanes rishiriensis TaxID=1050105 RepID=A0A919KBR4_9ACTN|nr:molybdopterin molybdotransferase MoeA [Actinoplanes rishiriensis]GIF02319.1 molybdopterin molybdenumtransferase MoeA [Actinoplanes rishiriensis]
MTSTVRPHPHHRTRVPMPWHEARSVAHRLPVPISAETVPLEQAGGRTLAEPVHAAVMLPGFDNAAMDGYATCGFGPWRVTGRVLAGEQPATGLLSGEAAEIATGAPVPSGADRVVEYEITTRHGDIVSAQPGPRRHVRRHGEYVTAGQQLLPAGHLLTPAALGLAASVGVDAVAVRAVPRVTMLITGDEVIDHGLPGPGQVRDAIGPMLTGLLASWHIPTTRLRVPDQPAGALTAALTSALAAADITVVCGSSSVGPADHLHAALNAAAATVYVDGVACRPGHPQLLARTGDRWIVGVPGNPFAALVASFTLLQPLLAGLAGRALPQSPSAVVCGDARPAAGHTRLIPVRLHQHLAHPIDGAHPGYLGPAASADALAVIPPTWRPGQRTELLGISS